jgi:hypothetical protein
LMLSFYQELTCARRAATIAASSLLLAYSTSINTKIILTYAWTTPHNHSECTCACSTSAHGSESRESRGVDIGGRPGNTRWLMPSFYQELTCARRAVVLALLIILTQYHLVLCSYQRARSLTVWARQRTTHDITACGTGALSHRTWICELPQVRFSSEVAKLQDFLSK